MFDENSWDVVEVDEEEVDNILVYDPDGWDRKRECCQPPPHPLRQHSRLRSRWLGLSELGSFTIPMVGTL